MPKSSSEIKIYEFLDYREYLQEIFAAKKAEKRNFTHRYFAKQAGFGSHSYLRMVFKGERNISVAVSHQIARALELNKKETTYFENLVLFNQAKTDDEKDMYFGRLVQLKPKSHIRGLDKDKFEYFTKRYFVTIREMVALPNFKDNSEWIASRLKFPVKPTDVEHAIQVLLRLGLLARDEEGKLVHSNATLKTTTYDESLEIQSYNRNLLNEAKEALLQTSPKLTDIASITIPAPLKSLPQIKEVLQKCREDIASIICNGTNNYDEVFQINMQLFPLTKTKENKS